MNVIMENQTIKILLVIISFIIYVSVFSLFLKLLLKIYPKIKIKFLSAFKIQFLVELTITLLIICCIYIVSHITFLKSAITIIVLSSFIYLFVGIPFYALMIKNTYNIQIGFKRAVVLSLIIGTVNFIISFLIENLPCIIFLVQSLRIPNHTLN